MPHIPLRSCLFCHKKYPKRKLLGITRTASGNVVIAQYVSGRSVYICSQLCAKRLSQGKENFLSHLLKIPVDTMLIQQEVNAYFAALSPSAQD